MREYGEKKRARQLPRLILKGAASLGLLALTAFLVHATWAMYIKMAEASQAQEDAEVQLANLEAQERGVTTTLATFSSQLGREEQLRHRFGVAKPGEGEIDIIEVSPAASSTSASHESWWLRLFNVFKVW